MLASGARVGPQPIPTDTDQSSTDLQSPRGPSSAELQQNAPADQSVQLAQLDVHKDGTAPSKSSTRRLREVVGSTGHLPSLAQYLRTRRSQRSGEKAEKPTRLIRWRASAVSWISTPRGGWLTPSPCGSWLTSSPRSGAIDPIDTTGRSNETEAGSACTGQPDKPDKPSVVPQ